MLHRNVRLTVHGRRLLVERVRSGRLVAHVAGEMGVSRATAHKWVHRWRSEGEAGLCGRPSRPVTNPHQAPPEVEEQVCELRQDRKLGPARTGPVLDVLSGGCVTTRLRQWNAQPTCPRILLSRQLRPR